MHGAYVCAHQFWFDQIFDGVISDGHFDGIMVRERERSLTNNNEPNIWSGSLTFDSYVNKAFFSLVDKNRSRRDYFDKHIMKMECWIIYLLFDSAGRFYLCVDYSL